MSKPTSIDVTKMLTYLQLMITIADKLSETTPYPKSIKKVRDNAAAFADKTRKTMEH